MTGSRKVIEVLNRHGHCIGYHTAEIIETDLATQIVNRQNATPDGLLQHSGLCTSLAWDNYDERTETLSGAGTLHDTVGICYQNETDLSPATNVLANDSVDSSELRIPAQIIPETYKLRRSLKLQQPILDLSERNPGSQFSNIQLQIFPGPQSWLLWNVEICFGWSMLLLPQRLQCGWVGTLRWLMTHYQNRRSPIWKI